MEIGPIYDEIPNIPSCHCSTVLKLQNGKLLVVFFAGQFEKSQDVAVYGSFGDARGTKWTQPVIVANTPNHSEGSPVLYQEPGGRLHLFYLTMHHGKIIKGGWSVCVIKQKYSDDSGITWSEPVYLRKNWFWVLRCSALLLQNNSVILPVHLEAGKMHSFFYINPSPTLDKKWVKSKKLNTPKGCDEPSICELSDGSLLCSLRTHDKVVYFARSNDHGMTWTKPEPSKFRNPNSQTAIFRSSTNKIVLVLNDAVSGRYVLSYSVSEDDGVTWSPTTVIEGSPEERAYASGYSYPCIAELDSGEILVTYTHLRTHIYWAKFKI
jgi:predicted neuraminidase